MEINWDKIPPEYNWVTTDSSGHVWAFEERPYVHAGKDGVWEVNNGSRKYVKTLEFPDWRLSIEKRPPEPPRYYTTPYRYNREEWQVVKDRIEILGVPCDIAYFRNVYDALRFENFKNQESSNEH